MGNWKVQEHIPSFKEKTINSITTSKIYKNIKGFLSKKVVKSCIKAVTLWLVLVGTVAGLGMFFTAFPMVLGVILFAIVIIGSFAACYMIVN